MRATWIFCATERGLSLTARCSSKSSENYFDADIFFLQILQKFIDTTSVEISDLIRSNTHRRRCCFSTDEMNHQTAFECTRRALQLKMSHPHAPVRNWADEAVGPVDSPPRSPSTSALWRSPKGFHTIGQISFNQKVDVTPSLVFLFETTRQQVQFSIQFHSNENHFHFKVEQRNVVASSNEVANSRVVASSNIVANSNVVVI